MGKKYTNINLFWTDGEDMFEYQMRIMYQFVCHASPGLWIWTKLKIRPTDHVSVNQQFKMVQ